MRKPIPLVLLAAALAACGGAATGRAAQNHRSAGGAPPAVAQAGPSAAPAAAASPASGSSSVAPTPAGVQPAGMPGVGGAGPARPAATPTPVKAGTVVTSWNSPKYGEILTGANGHVLYLFTPDDATGTPSCTGSCAAAWPPLMAGAATPQAQGQAKQSLLGVSNGQVTYNGHPLYYYAGDPGPDQTNGQGSGGIWYVVSVSGSPVVS